MIAALLATGCSFVVDAEGTPQPPEGNAPGAGNPTADAGTPQADGSLPGAPDAAPVAALLVDHNFDDASFGTFVYQNGAGDACDIQSGVSMSGFALHCVTDASGASEAYLQLTFDPTAELYVNMDVRLGIMPNRWINFVQAYYGDDRGASAHVYDDGMIDVWNWHRGDNDWANGAIVTDTWYQLEIYFRASDTDAEMTLSIDGTERLAISGFDGGGLMDRIGIGANYQGNPIADNELFIDNVVVSNQPID